MIDEIEIKAIKITIGILERCIEVNETDTQISDDETPPVMPMSLR